MRKALIILVLGLVAAACSRQAVPIVAPATGEETSSPSTSPSPAKSESPSSSPAPATSSPAETMQVTVYYLVSSPTRLWLAPERHQIPRTVAVAKAALETLVHGTAQDPQHSTPYPRASKISSIAITDRVATVDWSAEVLTASAGSETEELGIQSVVYTLTEFATISRVRFTVEGKDRGTASNGRTIEDWWGHGGLAGQPWDRDPAIEVLEPITLWTPLNGSRSTGTIRLSGDASTFEANVGIVLRNASGTVELRTSTTAGDAAPGRGTFTKTITFKPPTSPETWTLQVIEDSAEDGSVRFMEDRSIRVG